MIFMGFLDNLESNLKSLESNEERNADAHRDARNRASDKAKALASAPFADALKTGAFTHDLLAHATRIGFSQRTKVQPTWLGTYATASSERTSAGAAPYAGRSTRLFLRG